MLTLSQEQTIEVFGDFHPYLTGEGIPSAEWESDILEYIVLPAPLPLAWNKSIVVSNIRCHKLITKFLSQALNDLHQFEECWNTINDFGGVYQFRLQRKSKTLSKHCWGIAIDIDVTDNPFGRVPQVNPKTVEIFQDHGFIWGGNFPAKRRDGMHFEFANLGKL